MSKLRVPIKRLKNSINLGLPSYASESSVGADLLAAISETLTLPPGDRRLVPSGIAIALPKGYEAQVRPRSGLALKYGVTCLNSPGTIDSDYRGEISVILINHGSEAFHISRGMRIAQLVIAPYCSADWDVTLSLDKTIRGKGGFGSTGITNEK